MSIELSHPYAALTPDRVLSSLEKLGHVCDGRIYPLNSYENRVYQVGVEGGGPIIAKFYRPGRWSDEQILEEHRFSLELQELEIPVGAPTAFGDQGTLIDDGEFRFAVFPWLPGRAPELDEMDNLLVLGRYIGRVHHAGASTAFRHRISLTLDRMAVESRSFLLENDFIPGELIPAYESLTQILIERMSERLSATKSVSRLRIHGDCHLGNVLWYERVPYFVDFDDTMMGPAIQDLWMLLSGSRDQRQAQLLELAEGYNEFHTFRAGELVLIETMRTQRIMHYSAWLARRWEDPAFPRSFPWFNTLRYWSEHVLELREQQAALDEAPLQLHG